MPTLPDLIATRNTPRVTCEDVHNIYAKFTIEKEKLIRDMQAIVQEILSQKPAPKQAQIQPAISSSPSITRRIRTAAQQTAIDSSPFETIGIPTVEPITFPPEPTITIIKPEIVWKFDITKEDRECLHTLGLLYMCVTGYLSLITIGDIGFTLGNALFSGPPAFFWSTRVIRWLFKR